jgi:PAS domain S-box-containing protein
MDLSSSLLQWRSAAFTISQFSGGRAMPLKPVLVGSGASVLLMATVLTGLYLGFETRDRFERIEESWSDYQRQADRRGALLSRLRGYLGYGGIIHNFKNYVLRQDPRYLTKLRKQFKDFKAAVSEFQATSPTQREREALAIIEKTISVYASKLPIAIQAASESWPPTKTDKFVKVDDSAALEAMVVLAADWREWRQRSSQAIVRSVEEGRDLIDIGFRFLLGLAIVALVLFALFFLLLRELRGTVSKLTTELRERLAAEHSANKFLRAVEQSPATIIITGTDGKIEYVNRKFCEVTGYQDDEVLGRTPRFLQSGEASESAYLDLRRRITRGEEWRGVFRNRKKSGQTYLAATAILPLRDHEGSISHYIGIGEDITEKALAREQIQKAQKMEAVGMLASGVAHDFNNVLTTILGNVHLAQLGASNNASVQDELEQIDIAAKRARNMVREILTFARRQPGLAFNLRVDTVVREVCQLMRASLPKNIVLSSSTEDETISVYADPTRLHQVLMNLCANSAEALGADAGEIRIEVDRKPAPGAVLNGNGVQHNGSIRIKVSDTGPGIPENCRDKVFEPFFTTKPPGKGTGLGLAVVSNLVGEMKGQLSCASSDTGTSFEILLLETPPSEEPDLPRREQAELSGAPTILLIDDEPEVVRACGKILETLGFNVESYTDPILAIEAFERAPEDYALVMTDLVMPELNGEEVCHAVRTQRADCPILLFSAFRPGTLDLDQLSPLKVIEKPIDPRILQAALNQLLTAPVEQETMGVNNL